MVKNRHPGKFIVIEGLDGSGKSTQTALLANHLRDRGVSVYATLEPTQYLIGGLIRSFLANDWKSSPQCLQLLFAADRAHHLDKEIIPLLKAGSTVVCDRYFFSSFAYGALDCDPEWLIEANREFIMPDLTVMLESNPRNCIKRMSRERISVELFEREAMLKRVWQNYKKIAARFDGKTKIVIVDGDRAIGEIFESIKKIVADSVKC